MAAKVEKEKCTACGSCVDVCPTEAILVDDVAIVDEEKCVDCGTCVDECPSEAITVD
jgi:Fe-S-cluster-containing hydrogenase component 2